MATLDITTNASNRDEFTKTFEISKKDNTTIRLATEGTYVDKDVLLTLNVRSVAGTIGGSATAGKATAVLTNTNSVATITNLSGKTAGTDYWGIKATATGTAGNYTPKYTVTTSGWLNSTVTGTAQTVNVTGDTTGQTIYIPKATLKWSNNNVLVNSAGYLPSGNTTLLTMNNATITSEGSVSTAPSVAVTNSTTMATTTTNTGFSFTVGGTPTNGSVQTKYKVTTAGYAALNTSGTNSGTVTVTPGVTGGKTVYIQAAVGKVNMSAGAGSCILQSSSNITTSDSNTSGVSVTFRGSGAVSATAAITTAGYTNTTTSFATGTSTSSGTKDLTKYITGVKIVAPSSGTRSFSIQVPNGNTTDFITFVFTVDSSGNVTVAGPD